MWLTPGARVSVVLMKRADKSEKSRSPSDTAITVAAAASALPLRKGSGDQPLSPRIEYGLHYAENGPALRIKSTRWAVIPPIAP